MAFAVIGMSRSLATLSFYPTSLLRGNCHLRLGTSALAMQALQAEVRAGAPIPVGRSPGVVRIVIAVLV